MPKKSQLSPQAYEKLVQKLTERIWRQMRLDLKREQERGLRFPLDRTSKER